MRPFTSVRSPVIPLLATDVDTDQIIPAPFVTATTREELQAALFERQRARNPAFVFNRPEMRGRSIMLVGTNFGCGSSRECAVWAIDSWDIRAIVGRSFNLTFYGNCLQNGVLPVVAPPDAHAALCEAVAVSPGLDLEVDLEAQEVRASAAGLAFAFEIERFARELLLRGIDELQYLLECDREIAAYEATRRDGL